MPDLVAILQRAAAVSNAGGLGVFGAGKSPPDVAALIERLMQDAAAANGCVDARPLMAAAVPGLGRYCHADQAEGNSRRSILRTVFDFMNPTDNRDGDSPASRVKQDQPVGPGFEDVRIKLGSGIQTIRRPIVPPEADFSEEAVIAAARELTGLQDFGDDPFLANLRVLICAMEGEAQLNAFGRVMARQTLIARLADRLRAQALFNRFPEILETNLGPMTFIVGPARSGTTRAHRLLSRDPRFLYLRDWEINFPVPMPASFGDGPDPRIRRARGAHAAFLAMNPANANIHTLDAEAPEEEIGLLNMSFASMMLEAQRFIPSYGRYCLETNQDAAYAYMRKLIKLIAWFRKDDPRRPWVFKSPQHMQDLDALVHVFPEAKVVFMHRDPRKTVASTCSMFWNISILGSDHNDPHALGHYLADKIQRQVQKVELERRSLLPAEQQLDVRYADINADWQRETRRVYDFIGLDFSREAQAALHAAAGDREARHGGHKYRLDDFGLAASGIDSMFADYVDRYGIPRELN